MSRRNHLKKKNKKARRKKRKIQPLVVAHDSEKLAAKDDKPCPRCGHHAPIAEDGGLNCHHILPLRWYQENGNHILLCYPCHHEILESLIEQVESYRGGGLQIKLESWEYFLVVAIFLKYPEAGVQELLKHCLAALKE